MKFKSPRNTAPRISENGTKGEQYEAHIVLKIMSDVGVVGKPSAGKSTLLSAISNAKAKIAEYEFTTLVPQLGMVKYYDKSFVIADLPGLIEGASQGKGLGIQFLRHIERCRVIAHIIDFGSEYKDPIADFEIINQELKSYSLNLENKDQLVIANKSDLPNFAVNIAKFKEKYPHTKIVEISALGVENLDEVKKELLELIELNKLKPTEEIEDDSVVEIQLEEDYKVISPYAGYFEISGPKIQQLYDKIPLVSYDNLLRFNHILKKLASEMN